MYDLGGSWYITGEFDNIEANIITKERVNVKCCGLRFESA